MKNAILSAIAAVTLVCTDPSKQFQYYDKEAGLVAVICADGQAEFNWPALRVIAKKPIEGTALTSERIQQIFAITMVAAHDNKQQ